MKTLIRRLRVAGVVNYRYRIRLFSRYRFSFAWKVTPAPGGWIEDDFYALGVFLWAGKFLSLLKPFRTATEMWVSDMSCSLSPKARGPK